MVSLINWVRPKTTPHFTNTSRHSYNLISQMFLLWLLAKSLHILIHHRLIYATLPQLHIHFTIAITKGFCLTKGFCMKRLQSSLILTWSLELHCWSALPSSLHGWNFAHDRQLPHAARTSDKHPNQQMMWSSPFFTEKSPMSTQTVHHIPQNLMWHLFSEAQRLYFFFGSWIGGLFSTAWTECTHHSSPSRPLGR